MNLPEPIVIGSRRGDVSFFDANLKQVPKKQATIAKVRFEDGRIEFFTIERGASRKPRAAGSENR